MARKLNSRLQYLKDLDNFCHRNSKCPEIPYVQAFFTLRSRPFLSKSCSTSQILLAHSGPHRPNTTSPDPCSDFSSSSFKPSDHSPPPITPNPIAASPDSIPVPQPPPSTPSQPDRPPIPIPETSSEASAPPSTLRVLRTYPGLPKYRPHTRSQSFTAGPCSFHCSSPSFTGSSWGRRHCLGSCPILPLRPISK